MKQRNKFEKAVLAQSEKLRPITAAQIKWAFRECIEHYANRLPKGRTTCMDCGHSWMMEQETTNCSCPQCGAKLKVVTTFVRKIKQKQYFTILTTCGKYQILRLFLLIAEMEKGCKARPYALEIGQYWWNDAGRKTFVGILRVLGRYIDTFSFGSPMAIRHDNLAYDHIAHAPVYPRYIVTPTLKRNGFNGDLHDIVPTALVTGLLSDPKAETLMKTAQYPLLRHYLTGRNMDQYWASIKICIRNKYIIPDGSMWCDTIDLLRHFGKDIHSPKYICPLDLKSEHDKLVQKRTLQRVREKLALQMQEAVAEEETYKRTKSKFFGLAFTDGTIEIRVLESVAEFVEEGLHMKHCVFTNGYYLKKDSLILSATIEGKRIETVEVSLKTLNVVQSRGVCNSNTEYHDRIISLVNSNMKQIRQRLKKVV